MPAPSGTVWGSIVGGYGRIGIYTSIENTNTRSVLTFEIWFWSKYSVSDSSNTLYYDNLKSSGSATTIRDSRNISTTNDDGSGWSTNNQVLLTSGGTYYTRGGAAVKRYLYAKLTDVDRVGGTMYASTTVTIPAIPSYTVTYNANGGSNAPSKQTKWYDASLTLTSSKPKRTGYTFLGWSTSASGEVEYASNASYTANADVTLYAVWRVNTYTISYNANGGSGAPPSQTKTHGTDLTLSSVKPTRTNYTFKGWAISASATKAAYAAGSKYSGNATATLYAVWELTYTKPKISNLTAARCDSTGKLSDEGTYAKIGFEWTSSLAVLSIVISWVDATGQAQGSATVSASGTGGTISQVVGGGAFNTEKSYSFTVKVTDSSGNTERSVTMSGNEYHIDFGENSVAVGKPAETLVDKNGSAEKTLDVKWRSKFRNNVSVGDKLYYHDGNQGIFLSWEGFMHLQRTSAQGYHPYIGFYIDNATEANGMIRLNSSTKLMEFLSAAGYKFGNNVEMASDLDFSKNKGTIYGVDQNGLRKNAFQAQNQNGNTIVGYGNWSLASGDTNVYGYDINIGVANIASPGTYRPYRRRGDTLSLTFRGSGYVTNAGKDVSFWIPFSEPIIGSPTVTLASNAGFVLRQGNAYTHGSSASVNVSPDSYEATATMHHGVYVKAVFSNTTNVTNNDSIGIYWDGTITFS